MIKNEELTFPFIVNSKTFWVQHVFLFIVNYMFITKYYMVFSEPTFWTSLIVIFIGTKLIVFISEKLPFKELKFSFLINVVLVYGGVYLISLSEREPSSWKLSTDGLAAIAMALFMTIQIYLIRRHLLEINLPPMNLVFDGNSLKLPVVNFSEQKYVNLDLTKCKMRIYHRTYYICWF